MSFNHSLSLTNAKKCAYHIMMGSVALVANVVYSKYHSIQKQSTTQLTEVKNSNASQQIVIDDTLMEKENCIISQNNEDHDSDDLKSIKSNIDDIKQIKGEETPETKDEEIDINTQSVVDTLNPLKATLYELHLNTPEPISPPTLKPQPTPKQQNQAMTLHTDKSESWRYDRSDGLSKIRLNQTRTILIIIVIFITLQFIQYNILRDAMTSTRFQCTSSSPSPDNITYATEDILLNMLRKQQEVFEKAFDETVISMKNDVADWIEHIRDTIVDEVAISSQLYNNITYDMQNIMKQHVQAIFEQTLNEIRAIEDGIRAIENVITMVNDKTNDLNDLHDKMRENMTNARRQIVHNIQRIDEIANDVNDMVSQVEIQDTLAWYDRMSSINWISSVVAMPQTIPYGFNDFQENAEKLTQMSLFNAFKRGIKAFYDETKCCDTLQCSANVDITEVATPYTLRPHDCLQFSVEEKHRWIEVKLMERIIPREFEYIHMDKERLDSVDRNKSPKKFVFFGKIRDGYWSDIKVKEDKILNVNESVLKLEFDTNIGIEFMRIKYDVNDDAQSTRIYRMSIRGVPDVLPSFPDSKMDLD